MLTLAILKGKNEMDMVEWRYFLAGPQGEIEIKNNPTNWIPENQWSTVYREINGMSHLPAFEGFEDYFLKKSDLFKNIYDSP
jgi:dynein heavy chain, axonemal